jgi:hypothetical protein
VTLEEIQKRLKTLEDIEAIKNLHREYVFMMINHRWADMAELFAENATAAIAEHEPRTGKKEIARFLTEVISKQVGWELGHFVTQPVISVEGDKAKGHWLLFLLFPEPAVKWMQARYDCEYIREGGKWKFSLVKFQLPWPIPPSGKD